MKAFIALALALVGCTPAPAEVQSRRLQCREIREPVPDGGIAPSGNPDELSRRARATYRAPFVWTQETRKLRHAAQGQEANLELILEPTGPVRFVRYETFRPPGNGPVDLMDLICPSLLEIEASMQLKSSDGLLAERGPVTLQMAGDGQTTLRFERKFRDLRGAFEISENPTDLRVDHLEFSFRLGSQQSLQGYVGGHYSGPDPSFGYLVRFACFPNEACR